MTTKTVALTSGTSWAIPSDALGSTAQVICFGAGANGTNGSHTGTTGCGDGTLTGGTGGASGAVASKTTFNIPSSGSVTYQIASSNASVGTWFSSSGTVQAASANGGSNVGDTTFASKSGLAPSGGGLDNSATGGAGAGAPGISTQGSGQTAGTPSYTATAGGTFGPGTGGNGGVGSTIGAGTSTAGGVYGAGGGGGGAGLQPIPCTTGFSYFDGTGSAGAQGLIVIIYTVVTPIILYGPVVSNDFPNPRGYIPANELKTFVSSATLLTLVEVNYSQPFGYTDWPVPKSPFFNRNVVSFAGPVNILLVGKDQFFGVAGQPPPNRDWPNPRGYVPNIDLKTIAQSNVIIPSLQITIYGEPGMSVPNYDWPVPKGYVPSNSLKTWSQHLTLDLSLINLNSVHNQSDWPVPKGYIPSTALKTWLNPVSMELLHKDQFFSAGGTGPIYDYPNPRGYVFPVANRGVTYRSIFRTISPSSYGIILG